MTDLEHLTVARAALLVNRSPRWIQKLIQRGDISAKWQQFGSRKFALVDLTEVRAVIAASHKRGRGRQTGSKNKPK